MDVARSISAPLPAHAYNLRGFSAERGRLTHEPMAAANTSRMPSRIDLAEGTLSTNAPSLPDIFTCNLRKSSADRVRLTPEQMPSTAKTSHGADRPSPVQADTTEGTRSRSTPTLAHAYNLRKYSSNRGRLTSEPGATAWLGRRADHAPAEPGALAHSFSQVDLVGGNGRWRQKRAKEQWILDQAVSEKQRRERLILRGEKKRKDEERAAMRRRQQEEDQRLAREFEESRRRDLLEQEERERQLEEERRLKEEQQHSEWLAMQPTTCTSCMGSGKCTHCNGEGFFFAMFLSPSVDSDSTLGYGRAEQGCPECGGCAQNVVGDLRRGSGKCYTCDGVGKVTPDGVERRASLDARHLLRSSVSKVRRMSDVVDIFRREPGRSPAGSKGTNSSGPSVSNAKRSSATCKAIRGLNSLGKQRPSPSCRATSLAS